VSGRKPILIAQAGDRVPSRLVLAAAGLSPGGIGQLRTASLKPILMTETGLIVARSPGARV